MAEQGECSADACRGIAVAEDRCIVHCSEEGQDKVIAELADGRQFDVFRATVVPPGLFRRAMEALPSAGSQHPVVVRPDFTGAKFGFAPRFDQKR